MGNKVTHQIKKKIGYEEGRDLDIQTCDRLRLARIKSGLEQDEIAEILGVSSSTVSNWECGRTAPKLPMMAAWAQVTGYNLSSLVYAPAEAQELATGAGSDIAPHDSADAKEVSLLPCLGSNQEPCGFGIEQTCDNITITNVAGVKKPSSVSC